MKIGIGTKVYVFTNWGLVKAYVSKEGTSKVIDTPQYQVKIDIDRHNKGKNYNFWFVVGQFHKYYFTAIVSELFKPFGWFVKGLFKF